MAQQIERWSETSRQDVALCNVLGVHVRREVIVVDMSRIRFLAGETCVLGQSEWIHPPRPVQATSLPLMAICECRIPQTHLILGAL